MLVKTLDEATIYSIGHAFGYYNYGEEEGLLSLYSGPEAVAAYICGFVRGMIKGGFLHTTSERHEGFIAYRLPGESLGMKTLWPLAQGAFRALRPKEMVHFVKAMKRGGMSLRNQYDKQHKPYIYVGMVCVREKYQGQGYMRKLLEMTFREGDRLQVPVILDTDAKSKCDKYVHLGMELTGTRSLGAGSTLYDLLRYPEAK